MSAEPGKTATRMLYSVTSWTTAVGKYCIALRGDKTDAKR